MDVRYFVHERTRFLRQLYSISTAPYLELQKKISDEVEPYTPYFDESGEPPYLGEWLEAEESMQVLGRACVSMLSATLHLYFKTWEVLLRVPLTADFKKRHFKDGWVKGYKAYFEQHAGVPFDTCPIDLALLEELVIARNQVQHPDSITSMSSHYSASDLQKLPHPFFVDQNELERIGGADAGERNWLMAPSIKVTPEKFELALKSVERFADWLESVEWQ